MDVLNRALTLLGEKECTNWDSPSTGAGIKVKPWVLESIDEVISSFLWQEVMTSLDIEKEADLSPDGRSRFVLPSDCLRPLGYRYTGTEAGLPETAFTRMSGMGMDSNDYEIEGNELLTYGDEITLVYNRREDDPTKWTSELGRCIYHAAAINSGQSVTSDARIVANVLEKYERLVRPRARLLQSKYKKNAQFLPQGFTYIRSHYS